MIFSLPLLIGGLVAIFSHLDPLPSSLLPGFTPSALFSEQSCWETNPLGIRLYINAPLQLKSPRRTLLLYATPNGNSLEQTLGCKTTSSDDWRMDIQHVAAQTRMYRSLNPTQDVILAVVQAPKLSWPTFRKDHQNANKIIHALVLKIRQDTKADDVILSGHSGGGSFLFGFLDATDSIPPFVNRMIFLDANYSFSAENKHGDKLIQWLQAEKNHKLSVIAYDDREIMLSGKKVIGPTGGTYRATGRMIKDLEKSFQLERVRPNDFQITKCTENQVRFDIHLNPDNKILHTALVGEMNGLLHGLTFDNPAKWTWGRLGGPRAYEKHIQKEPFFNPKTIKASLPSGIKGNMLTLPERKPSALTGSAFKDNILNLDRKKREEAIIREILSGNVPQFLRQFVPVQLQGTGMDGNPRTILFETLPDYLAIGSDTDFFRVPMTPLSAWTIANVTGTSLLTSKTSDHVHAVAQIKLDPKPLVKNRDKVESFFEHQQMIQKQLMEKTPGLLISGIKKDVVLSRRLLEKPNRVAIYGWHHPDGTPIQPTYAGHVDWYVDYSHGIRLIHSKILVNDKPMDYHKALQDPVLAWFLSSEGQMDVDSIIKHTGWKK